jgi:NAD(P)-dependent dehydrogenase (short-subunit alcohol dehydrogenase family)
VTQEQQWDEVLAAVVAQFGRLDLLVNNAGMSFAKAVTDTTLAEWRQVMAVNLDSVFLSTTSAIRAMRQGSRGVIINIASASGLKASPGGSAYSPSKAAVRMFVVSPMILVLEQSGAAYEMIVPIRSVMLGLLPGHRKTTQSSMLRRTSAQPRLPLVRRLPSPPRLI